MKHWVGILVIWGGLIATSGPVLAQSDRSTSTEKKERPSWLQRDGKSDSRSGSGAGYLLALLSIFAVTGGLAWWGRRHLPQNSRGDGELLEVVARTGVGPGQSLVRMRAGDREFVIAVSRNDVKMLIDLGTDGGDNNREDGRESERWNEFESTGNLGELPSPWKGEDR